MAKTLVFNGSPRKNGDTRSMIDMLQEKLEGEIKVADVYYSDMKPCVDCRYCFKNKGCAIKDDMQEIYAYIEECDHIVIAAPIYFGELSGQLLAVMSRLQTYFSARYIRKEEPILKSKTGGIILSAGSFGPREKAEDTAKFLLEQLRTESLGTIYLDYTDKKPAKEREEAIEGIPALAARLNGTEVM